MLNPDQGSCSAPPLGMIALPAVEPSKKIVRPPPAPLVEAAVVRNSSVCSGPADDTRETAECARGRTPLLINVPVAAAVEKNTVVPGEEPPSLIKVPFAAVELPGNSVTP